MGAGGNKGKADLLRLLAATRGLDGLRDDPASCASAKQLALLGLLLDERSPKANRGVAMLTCPTLTLNASGGPAEDVRPINRARPRLQARFFAVLQESAQDVSEPVSVLGKPLGTEDCSPRKTGALAFVPLVGRSRLWPALYRSLASPRSGRVDLPALVRKLSAAEVPSRLPRRKLRKVGGEVVVIMDRAKRLTPYDRDYTQVLQELKRLHGAASIVLWLVSESPDATISVQKGRGLRQETSAPISVPAAGTPVLILGDLGQLSSDPSAVSAWVAFCRRLEGGGVRPVAWVPMSGRLVSTELTRHAQVHCLAPGDLRPVKGRKFKTTALAAPLLETLLTRIACCVRVEPALLRSLRLMGPDTAAEPGLEALVWAPATAVDAGYRFCEIGPASQADYRAAFAALGQDEAGRAEQDEILRRMLAAHAYRGRSTESIELLIWQAHAGRDAPAGEPAERLAEAVGWVGRLGEFANEAPGDVVAYARDLLARQGGDCRLLADRSRAFAQLWALTGEQTIPQGIDPVHVAEARQRQSPMGVEARFHLVQHGGGLFLESPERFGVRELDGWAPVRWPIVTVVDGLEWSRSDGTQRCWLTPKDEPVALPLGESPEKFRFSLVSGKRRYLLGLLTRPSWASEWGMEAEGLYALAPSPLGGVVKLHATPWGDDAWSGAWPPSPRAFQAVAKPIGLGMQLGSDLEFGLYLDVPFGNATQRFRYIEPGEFVMGSPDTEPERFDDEGPQHVVRLTEGFWLAETACSQAVCEAVTGSNPSRFKDDPQNPVEQVSWDDVGEFLKKLGELLAGVRADLPTEAEWEYACRAGTETAFNWGDGLSPAQANYGAKKAYADGPTGEYRAKTMPVKSFAPNVWGLHQMHGNVWEWCADGLRPYDGTVQENPRGEIWGAVDAPRVTRGGSWDIGPRGLRAARRNQGQRDGSSDYLGFRFCLRPTSPDGCEERLLEAGDFRPLGVEGDRGYLDDVMSVITPPDNDGGPVPWNALRETLVPSKAKRSKAKKGGKI